MVAAGTENMRRDRTVVGERGHWQLGRGGLLVPGDPLKDDRRIWLSKERERRRVNLVLTFLGWCISGCIYWCGRS